MLYFILFTKVDCILEFFDCGLEENETTAINVALMWWRDIFL